MVVFFLKYYLVIQYLHLFWVQWVFIEALVLLLLQCTGSKMCQLLKLWHRLSCSIWDISSPTGIEPMSPALEGEFLTTGHQGTFTSQELCLYYWSSEITQFTGSCWHILPSSFTVYLRPLFSALPGPVNTYTVGTVGLCDRWETSLFFK